MTTARPKTWKWLRRLAVVITLVLLAIVLRAPERLTGFVLGRILGTSVTIADLDFHSLRSLTATGIEVGAMDGLESAAVDVVEIQGSLLRALKGEVDSVQVAGARGVPLLPSPWLEEKDAAGTLRVHFLSAEGVQILIKAADGSTAGPFEVASQLREIGGEMTGNAEIRSAEASLDAILHFALGSSEGEPEGEHEEATASNISGALRGLQAVVDLEPEGVLAVRGDVDSLHLERGGPPSTRLDVQTLGFEFSQDSLERTRIQLDAASATALAPIGEELQVTSLRAEGYLQGGTLLENKADLRFVTGAARLKTSKGTSHSLPPPNFVANGIKLGDGAWQLRLVPQLDLLQEAEVRAVWHPEERLPRGIEGEVIGIKLAALQAWIPGLTGWSLEGLEINGLADVVVRSVSTDEGEGRLLYHLKAHVPQMALPEELGHRIPGAVRGSKGPRTFQEIAAELSGELDLAAPMAGGPIEVSFSVARGDLPGGILPARGTFSGQAGLSAPRRLEGGFSAVTAQLGRLEGKGSVENPAEAAPMGAWNWTWKGARLATVLSLLRSLEAPVPEDVSLDGRISASGTLSLAAATSLEGNFDIENGAGEGVSPATWSLSEVQGKSRFSWAGERLHLSDLHLQGVAKLLPLSDLPFTADASADWSHRTGKGELRSLTLDLGDLGTLTTVGSASPEEGLRARLQVAGVQLGAVRNFLRPLTGELASGLAIQGQAEGDLVLSVQDGTWRLLGPATVSGSGFASEDGSRVLEGFESQWQTSLVGSTSTEVPTRLTASADVTGFQLLWGLFYGDFSGLESTVSLDGALEALPQGADVTFPPWHLDVAWTVPEGPSLGLRLDRETATSEKADLHYSLALRLADLERSYGRYLQGPLTDSSPRFAQVRLAGDLGVSLEGFFFVNGGTTLTGQLLAQGLVVEGIEGQLAVRDLDLDLPVDLAWNAEGKLRRQVARVQAPELRGSVRFESADLQGFTLPPLRSVLQVRGDAISVDEAVAVPLAGGRIAFQGLNLIDLLTPERFAETALRIESLDLEKLAAGLGLPPLNGTVDGRLPRVRLDATTLQVDGGGEASLFGGTVRIGSISGENVLSRFPKVTFSADFQDIDLGRLTRRFDVGEMNGVLQGSVKDCELFRWVPVRCSGQFETVKRKGVKRNISVKAINNIAILGTGQGLGFLDKGIRSFFDKYTYSRLAIAMTLESDVFVLRGLEHRGEQELFLRGRLPFPINIINAQPGRTVSFQTMMRRLQTLDFNKATSSPAGGG